MVEHIRFHFDPVCPWCYQTSRWLRRLVALGRVELSWGLFSLQAQQSEDLDEQRGRLRSRTSFGLRAALVVRDTGGHSAVDAFYADLGRRIHEEGASPKDRAIVEGAIEEAGLERELAAEADSDEVVERLLAEHRDLVERTCSFGVPTVVLDGGAGRAFFGPVLTTPPDDDAVAVDLLQHVVGLARHEAFIEFKRERDRPPDLASVHGDG